MKAGLGDQVPFWWECQQGQNEEWRSRWVEGKWRELLGKQLRETPTSSSVDVVGMFKRPNMRCPAGESPQWGTVDDLLLLPVPFGKEGASLWAAPSSLLATLTSVLCTPNSAFSCWQDSHAQLRKLFLPQTSLWAQLSLGTQISLRSDIHSKPLFCLPKWRCCRCHVLPLHSGLLPLKPGLQCEVLLPSLPPFLDLINGMWLTIPVVVTQENEDCFEKQNGSPENPLMCLVKPWAFLLPVFLVSTGLCSQRKFTPNSHQEFTFSELMANII